MNREEYEQLMKDTIKYNTPDYVLQQIINDLRKEKIASYNENDKENSVLISTLEDKSERIKKCIDNNLNTFSIIEGILINKSYRYSIYYNCDNFNFNFNLNREQYIKLENFKGDNLKTIKDFINPILIENDNYIAIKFYKIINPFITKIDKTKNVLYPTLWVYHKNLKILEHRFDMLGFKQNDNFYETTLQTQLNIIRRDFKCTVDEFRTSSTIKYIVENKKDKVHEISQYMGLKADSLAKLKVGKTFVMPLIGELQILMEENRHLFNKTKDTRKIREILEKHIDDIRENAKYKSRLIALDKQIDTCIYINILFSYRDKNYDLFNFQEPRKINMELINYAIKYIYEAKQNIK